jgi:hypothetical protein
MEKLGIENLKKVVMLICALATTGDQIGHDTSSMRWGKLLGLITSVKDISGLDFKAVLPEIKDLDAAERAEILALFKHDFDLQDDKLEAAIEEGLVIAEDMVGIIDRSAKLVKTFKA